MFDPVTLSATAVASFLLPYAKKGAEKIGEAVAEKFGKSVGEELGGVAEKLWTTVKGAFTSEDEITTLDLFKKNPETFQKPVEQMLQQKLEQDPALAEQVHSLVNTKAAGGADTAASIMNASVAGILDMRGAHLTTQGGIFAGVVYGAPPAGPLPPVIPAPPLKDPKDNA